jgi:hypothetical protein
MPLDVLEVEKCNVKRERQIILKDCPGALVEDEEWTRIEKK